VKRLKGGGPLFSPEELTPVTGAPHEIRTRALAEQLAPLLVKLGTIYIPNPAHVRVFAAFDEVRFMGAASPIGVRRYCVRNAAPPASGKTAVNEAYKRSVLLGQSEEDRIAGKMPVIIVPLDRACTSRRLWASVLKVLGDEFWDKGTEDGLRARAYQYFVRLGVELMIVDEVQHLEFRSTARSDVTDSLKRILDDGVVSLALVGTEDAREMLQRNPQLSQRMLTPCDILPLDGNDSADRDAFKRFVTKLDKAIVAAGLTTGLSGLAEPRTIECLFDVSQGVVGRVANLLRMAFSRSFYRGADYIELCDLLAATDGWAVGQNIVRYNPFLLGTGLNVRSRRSEPVDNGRVP